MINNLKGYVDLFHILYLICRKKFQKGGRYHTGEMHSLVFEIYLKSGFVFYKKTLLVFEKIIMISSFINSIQKLQAIIKINTKNYKNCVMMCYK